MGVSQPTGRTNKRSGGQAPFSWTPLKQAFQKLGNSPELGVAACFGLIAKYQTEIPIQEFSASSIHFVQLLGPKTEFYLLAASILSGCTLGFVVVRLFKLLRVFLPTATQSPSVKTQPVTKPRRKETRPKRAEVKSELLPPIPASQDFQFVYAEEHNQDGSLKQIPDWSIMSLLGMFTGMIAFGGPGSGKTSGLIGPFIQQILRFRSDDPINKPAGLFLDVKGDLSNYVEEVAKRVGRTKDLLIIELDGITWNPLAGDEPAHVLAEQIMAVKDSLSQKQASSGDPEWIRYGVLLRITHAIGLIKLAHGWVTFASIYEIWTSPIGQPGVEEKELEEALHQYDIAFQKRLLAGELKESDSELYAHHRRAWTHDFAKQKPENASTLADATREVFTALYNPSNRKTFSPSKEDTNFPGLDGLLDSGALICLKLGSTSVVRFLGTLLKIQFQAAVLRRIEQRNTDRLITFIADEYQSFATSSSQGNVSDPDFFALCRQARVISLVATQSMASLEEKIGTKNVEVLLSVVRSKFYLALPTAQESKRASEDCGQHYAITSSETFGEQHQKTRYEPITDSVIGKNSTVNQNVAYREEYRPIFPAIEFQTLATHEVICSVFDGNAQQPPFKAYLKPDFRDIRTPHPHKQELGA